MAETRETRVIGVMDITPNLPNSPVMETVERFFTRLYNDFNLDTRPAGKDIDSLVRFMNVSKKNLVEALRQIKTDDSLILITQKLPSDRDRYIGTKRRISF